MGATPVGIYVVCAVLQQIIHSIFGSDMLRRSGAKVESGYWAVFSNYWGVRNK